MDNQNDMIECRHCGQLWRTETQLRSHRNNAKRCYQKEQAFRNSLGNKRQREAFDIVPEEIGVWHTSAFQEGHVPYLPNPRDNGSNLIHDSPLSIALAFKSCAGGKGLSEKDMTTILKVFLHPEFDSTKIPFSTGKSCKNWLKRRLETENGSPEVANLFCTTIIVILLVLLI